MKPKTFTIEGLPFRLTRDPLPELEPADPEADWLLDRHHERVMNRRPNIQQLQEAVRRYPEAPAFKNFLYLAFKIAGREEEAEQVVRQTVEAHPDYLFGRTAMADLALKQDQPAEARRWLGETLRLEDLYPEREVFHVSEVFVFADACVSYYLAVGDEERARQWRGWVKAIDPEHPAYLSISNQLGMYRMKKMKDRLEAEQKLKRSVDSFPKVYLESTDTEPELTHAELRLFYRHGVDGFPKKEMSKLAALPRASFIADLEKVLLDAAHRFDYFLDSDREWDATDVSFPVHALFWLGALEAEEALPSVLDLLRQGEEVLDYWFGDWRTEGLWITLYLIGRRRLPELRAFVLEGNLDATARAAVCQAVAQVAHHDPARRAEVIDWFREVLRYHLDRPDDDTLIDTSFLGQVAWALLDLRAHELEADLAQLFANQWVMPSLLGTWQEVQPRLQKPLDPADRDPLPESIYEFYDGSYLQRRMRHEPSEEDRRMLQDALEDPFLETLTRLMTGSALEEEYEDEYDDEYEYEEDWLPPPKPQTVIKTGPKIGRNDPCPCGSGKKYKRCCGKK